jgi:hypothetical protein
MPAMVGVLIALAAVSVVWAAAGSKLFINGKVASTDVRIINGQAYVPLRAVADALNMAIVKKPEGYEMAVAGGANQIDGSRQGKIGDWLFTGQWRFQVVGVKEVAEYTERYYQQEKTIKPKGPKEVLIVIDCRIKNGIKEQQSPVLTERMPRNTALADDAGHSYVPLDYDARQKINKTQSYEAEPLLPGAASDFALVFSVPKGTKLKALVFTCFRYTPPPPSDQDDVRVSLE